MTTKRILLNSGFDMDLSGTDGTDYTLSHVMSIKSQVEIIINYILDQVCYWNNTNVTDIFQKVKANKTSIINSLCKFDPSVDKPGMATGDKPKCDAVNTTDLFFEDNRLRNMIQGVVNEFTNGQLEMEYSDDNNGDGQEELDGATSLDELDANLLNVTNGKLDLTDLTM